MSSFTCRTKSPAGMAGHATGGTTASTAPDWHSCAARWLLGHRRKIEQPGNSEMLTEPCRSFFMQIGRWIDKLRGR